jgi:hypothetical protein
VQSVEFGKVQSQRPRSGKAGSSFLNELASSIHFTPHPLNATVSEGSPSSTMVYIPSSSASIQDSQMPKKKKRAEKMFSKSTSPCMSRLPAT